MKLIHNMVTIPLGEGEYLLVNTLNGLIDKINEEIYGTLNAWAELDNIEPSSDSEQELFDGLKHRGYIVLDEEAEANLKSSILDKLREAHKKAKEQIKNISFILTYDCNFRCPYCFEADNPPAPGIISKDMVDAAFSVVNGEPEGILLFGGEPLLLRNRDIIEYIVSKQPKAQYRITTNGYHLLEYLDLLKSMNIHNIQVTLDGNKESHDSRRYLASGSPTYDKIMEGIVKCLENKIRLTIRMNLDEDNYDECMSLRQALTNALPNSEDFLSFEMQPIFQIDNKVRSEMLERLHIADIGKSEEELFTSNRILTSSNPIIKYFLYKKKISPMYSFCHAHINSLVFDPLGDIYPCLVAVGKRHLSVGTYYPDIQFKDKSIFNRNIESIKECSECKHALICGGGCPISACNEEDVFKPNCASALHDIYNLVPIIYKKTVG